LFLWTEHVAEKGNTGMELIRHLYQRLPIIGRFAIFGLIVLLPKRAESFSLPGVVGLQAGGIKDGMAALSTRVVDV
jgi:hypothetical protein